MSIVRSQSFRNEETFPIWKHWVLQCSHLPKLQIQILSVAFIFVESVHIYYGALIKILNSPAHLLDSENLNIFHIILRYFWNVNLNHQRRNVPHSRKLSYVYKTMMKSTNLWWLNQILKNILKTLNALYKNHDILLKWK